MQSKKKEKRNFYDFSIELTNLLIEGESSTTLLKEFLQFMNDSPKTPDINVPINSPINLDLYDELEQQDIENDFITELLQPFTIENVDQYTEELNENYGDYPLLEEQKSKATLAMSKQRLSKIEKEEKLKQQQEEENKRQKRKLYKNQKVTQKDLKKNEEEHRKLLQNTGAQIFVEKKNYF